MVRAEKAICRIPVELRQNLLLDLELYVLKYKKCFLLTGEAQLSEKK